MGPYKYAKRISPKNSDCPHKSTLKIPKLIDKRFLTELYCFDKR